MRRKCEESPPGRGTPPFLSFFAPPRGAAVSYLDIARAALARSRGETVPTAPAPASGLPDLTGVLGLSLEAFEHARMTLEIHVSFLEVSLFFVSSSLEGDSLSREGISRGRIWTAHELQDVLRIPSDQVPTIARAKALYGGEVVAVTPREVSEESEVSPWGERGETRGGELSEESERRGATP